jgi:hypothetical protein
MQAVMSCATRALARAPVRLSTAQKSFAAPRAAALRGVQRTVAAPSVRTFAAAAEQVRQRSAVLRSSPTSGT